MRTLFSIIFSLSLCSVASTAVFLNEEQALKLAFPEASEIQQKTIFLKDEQIQEIEKLSKTKVDSGILNFHIGKKDKKILGYAFFDSHNIRTMPETLMAVLNTDGTIRFVEILAFHEPLDYRASKKWLSLLKNKSLKDNLWVKRGLRNIAGSTLTTQAIAASVRRLLATYQTVIKEPSK